MQDRVQRRLQIDNYKIISMQLTQDVVQTVRSFHVSGKDWSALRSRGSNTMISPFSVCWAASAAWIRSSGSTNRTRSRRPRFPLLTFRCYCPAEPRRPEASCVQMRSKWTPVRLLSSSCRSRLSGWLLQSFSF